MVFDSQVLNDSGEPLYLRGWFNPYSGKLSFTLLRQGTGRIYGLDLGAGHRDPKGETIEGTHKHRWTEQYRDKQAYDPPDITADWNDPRSAWQQFCAELTMQHDGIFQSPAVQGELM